MHCNATSGGARTPGPIVHYFILPSCQRGLKTPQKICSPIMFYLNYIPYVILNKNCCHCFTLLEYQYLDLNAKIYFYHDFCENIIGRNILIFFLLEQPNFLSYSGSKPEFESNCSARPCWKNLNGLGRSLKLNMVYPPTHTSTHHHTTNF